MQKNMSKKSGGALLAIFLILLALCIGICIGFGAYITDILNSPEYSTISTSNNDEKNESQKLNQSNIKTIALFGTDSRDKSNADSGRADTIMVASINTSKKTIKLISIPRDTYVNVPGYGKTKINHSYAYGKEELAIQTINNNFGLNIKDYATIDFSGLIEVINDVGGVEVEITEAEMKYINSRSNEAYEISGNEQKILKEYGKIKLDGEQALTHSRNRTVGNDFVRASRQRDVLTALLNELSNNKLKLIMSLDDILEQVKTNINFWSYFSQLTSLGFNSSEYIANIISVQIPSADYSSGKMISGVYYYVTDLEECKEDFIEYIYNK